MDELNKELLKLTTNQYKAGTVDYSQILTAQINYYNAAISTQHFIPFILGQQIFVSHK